MGQFGPGMKVLKKKTILVQKKNLVLKKFGPKSFLDFLCCWTFCSRKKNLFVKNKLVRKERKKSGKKCWSRKKCWSKKKCLPEKEICSRKKNCSPNFFWSVNFFRYRKKNFVGITMSSYTLQRPPRVAHAKPINF